MHIVKQYKHRILAWVRHSKNKQKEQRSISEHTIKHGFTFFPPKKKTKNETNHETYKLNSQTPKCFVNKISTTKVCRRNIAEDISRN